MTRADGIYHTSPGGLTMVEPKGPMMRLTTSSGRWPDASLSAKLASGEDPFELD
jgi:hypothetical protein